MGDTLIRFAIAALCALGVATPAQAFECSDLWAWLDVGCKRVADTYDQGTYELLISGYAYHLPSTYTPEKRAELNPYAWGGGLAKTVEDPDGDTHTDYILAFRDSNYHVQWNVGYAWLTYWGSRDGLQPGLGYSIFIVQRPDIASGVPFPAALPIAALRFQKASVVATYIPTLNGGVNHGSTLYVFGKYLF